MSESFPKVDILMAICNGEFYLEEQIKSILNQSYNNICLLLRDDGSADNSMEIVRKYADHFPDIVRLISDARGCLGAIQNFSMLLSHSSAQYVMFCDQDDIWLPKKIELTLKKIKAMESEFGENTPLLVHTNLKVVDEHLDVLSASFWKYHCLDPGATSLNRLLVQNVVTGCTVMINKPLKCLAYPIPENARWHDYWFALVAAAFGKIGQINKPMVLYRQHGKNQVGASKWPATLVQSSDFFSLLKKHKKGLESEQRQASVFLEQYLNLLCDKDHQIVACFSRFNDFGFFRKKYYIIKHKYYRTGFIRNIALLMFA